MEARSLYNGVLGIKAHSAALQSVADNLANTNTHGFKATRTHFKDLLSQEIATSAPQLQQVGLGSVTQMQNMMLQGSLEETQRATDLAVNGAGFFTVRDPFDQASLYYTRAGQFEVDVEGYLVNPQGYVVQGFGVSDEGDVAVGALQDIQIPLEDEDVSASSQVNLSINLNADDRTGHLQAQAINPADPSTYNTSMGFNVFDEEGNPRAIQVYYQRMAGLSGAVTRVWKAGVYELDASGNVTANPASPDNVFYLEFDSEGHLLGVSPTALIPDGDSYTFDPVVADATQTVSDQMGEELNFTGAGPAQIYRTNATIAFSGATTGTETVTIGTDVYNLPATGSAAAAGTWLAEQINSSAGLSYYAFDDGAGNLTLYSEGGAFDVTASAGITTDDDTSLDEVITAINNGTSATASINLNLGAMVGGETVSVDGNLWTYGVDFNTVAQLQGLIDGLAGVSATSQGNNIFVTAAQAGTDGNTIALATSDATNVALSGATLVNGLDGTNDPSNPTNVVASAVTAAGGVSLNLVRTDTGAAATITPGASTLGAGLGLDFNTYTQLAAATDGGAASNGGEVDLNFAFDVIDPQTGTVTTLNQAVTVDYNLSSEDTPPAPVTYIDPVTGQPVTVTPSSLYSGSTMSAGGYDTFLLEQDGRPSGYLINISVDKGGVVYGHYSNGHQQALAAVALTDFVSPEELKRKGNNLWMATEAAGIPQLGQAGDPDLALGTIESFALETSTVDVAQEMVNLINYQRSFQANTKSITTTDEMLKTAINMKT